jgi:Bacterial dnaA protein helix-turn-helix
MYYFNEIQQLVCTGEGILPSVLQQKTRKREIVFCRQLIMFLLDKYNRPKKETKREKTATLHAIGAKFDKDHATAMHSIQAINNLKDTNKEFAIKIASYEVQIETIVQFEKNIIKDRLVELKEMLKVKIDMENTLPVELVLVYNKLIQKDLTILP